MPRYDPQDEYGQLYRGGSLLVPPPELIEMYGGPDGWVRQHQAIPGSVVMRRRIIVVEGWAVVPRAAL
jgi:hypothetical protein